MTADIHNKKVYLDGKVCSSYLTMHNLFRTEEIIINKLKENLEGNESILDIGIGTGRTTSHLAQLTGSYIGIDYSKKMVEFAKDLYPSLDIRELDARDLRTFREHEFDIVFFSYNGMDYVSHKDRLLILSEIKRVLKPGGYFVFSTHNIKYQYFDTFRMKYEGNIMRYLWKVFNGGVARIKNLRHHTYTESYSIITDPGHNYRLLTYYISAQDQLKQLQSLGFSTKNVEIYDAEGNLNPDSPTSAWLYYMLKN